MESARPEGGPAGFRFRAAYGVEKQLDTRFGGGVWLGRPL